MGVGIHDDLSFGGGSCAEVCDTVALKGRGGRNEPVLIVSEYKVGTVVGDGICEALLHTYIRGRMVS